MKPPLYQQDLSLSSPILLDFQYKQIKVDKMLAILADSGEISQVPKQLAVDIGCSRGFFTSALTAYFENVFGIDIDRHAISLAKSEAKYENLSYIVADSLLLPMPDNSVDLVICNHVYEHVPCAERLFAEIFRVLKPSGACYLGSASRLTLIEPHYHLPFLSWLPKFMADRYMRITGKGEYYYEKLRTYWGIKQLISQFNVVDYTLMVVADPDRFKARDLFPEGGFLARIPLGVWKCFYWLLPTYIFILRKRDT
ncbi:MAG: hypothetical protein A2511_12245 [Deltaproteobacteria bacterium RIFOXYD12_FULL_50_9]|nr:MAG: hypothetical protein A2511_12245 [Deltaproteobacteria bacterium RIFOXYD12_FULL_50_9]